MTRSCQPAHCAYLLLAVQGFAPDTPYQAGNYHPRAHHPRA